jgi:hypothetical protein
MAARAARLSKPTGDEEMRCCQKAIFRIAIIGTLAMGSLAMGLVGGASAGCVSPPGLKAGLFHPISWQRTGEFGPGSPLLLVADHEDSVDRIVGFWRVTYTSKGNPGVPDGTVFDNAFQQWHSDGTEIHNSQAPAAAGNICLGVWKKTGRNHYTLNHFYLNSDPATDTLHVRVQLREEIDLDHGGNEHFGIVTFDVYDLAGNLLDHTQATVQATRITVKTDLKDLF